MNHTILLNSLIQKHALKSYLEIGVRATAQNFDKIECENKVGVDPSVKDDIRIYEGTSDAYFTGYDDRTYDLIFIDGLHHADQVKKDFENSLRCLNDNGFIVIHDTMPTNEATTCVPRAEQKIWHGDVYKFAMTLNQYDGMGFVTYDFDCGCTVVWKMTGKKGLPKQYDMHWQTYKQIGSVLLNVVPYANNI